MKHLLIVDDDKTNLTMARNALTDIYKVTAVISGDQALRFLAGNTPDLILLDINMPEMDGFEVMKKIKEMESLQNVPVIFLTADNEAETESRCFESGAADFIAKPFVPVVMRSRISRILELEELKNSLIVELNEKKQEVSDMKNRSSSDPLTGLKNRRFTEEAVNGILSDAKSGALFMIDMDNFKAINDIYGHMAGDDILRMAASVMRNQSSENDILCRIGGDEFVMFFRDGISKDELSDRARSVIDEFTSEILKKGYKTGTSVSVGISVYPDDGNDFGSLYNAADKALYFVKQNGKSSYHFYSEQKEEENIRSEKLADIDYIRDYLARSDSNNGSYVLSLESFHHVYNFIRRIVERSNREVQTILFTLSYASSSLTDYEPVLETMEKAVFTSLRRVDVSTRYSGRQIMVVLMDLDHENCVIIANRIIEAFRGIYTGPDADVKYEIERLEGKTIR